MIPQVACLCPPRSSKNISRWSIVLLLVTCAILSVPSYSIASAHRSQNDPTPLQLDVPVLRDLKGVNTHRFSVEMKADEYARINVQRKGIDVLVNVSAPGGTTPLQYENPAG